MARSREVWRPVPGLSGVYEVSDRGRVRRLKPAMGAKVGRILRPQIVSGQGYYKYFLSVDGKVREFRAARLVALAFIGPPPTSKHEVAHWDGNRTNNRPTNLRWATRKENIADAFRHGTHRNLQGGSRC